MKKQFFTTVIFFLAAAALHAQDDIQQVQKEWGKEKKELVRLGMELSAADSVKFWPVYNQYEAERQKIARERIIILDDYAQNYATLTSAKADELVGRTFKNDAAFTKLQEQYYTRFKTALNPLQAAKFLQIENYINAAIREQLQEALPIIGELKVLKEN